MKWFFLLLVIANLAFFAFSRLDDAPPAIRLQQREVNASQIKVVTGQLGDAKAKSSSVAAPTASPATAAPTNAPTMAPQPTPAPQQAKATPPQSASVCLRWHGITGEQIATARDRLKAMKLDMQESGSGDSAMVWVYIPPLASLDEAHKKAKQLEESGVNDYFVVNNGGRWQNAISLGLFSTREAGERYLATLKQQGVKSAVVRDKNDTLRQATFQLRNVAKADQAKLEKLAAQYKGSVIDETSCK